MQDRGQRRIERILDAAAEVIGEVGVGAAVIVAELVWMLVAALELFEERNSPSCNEAE